MTSPLELDDEDIELLDNATKEALSITVRSNLKLEDNDSSPFPGVKHHQVSHSFSQPVSPFPGVHHHDVPRGVSVARSCSSAESSPRAPPQVLGNDAACSESDEDLDEATMEAVRLALSSSDVSESEADSSTPSSPTSPREKASVSRHAFVKKSSKSQMKRTRSDPKTSKSDLKASKLQLDLKTVKSASFSEEKKKSSSLWKQLSPRGRNKKS